MSSTVFFLLFIPILAILLLTINFIFAPHNPYGEKDSVFECGFHSFLGQNRTQFSISFFIFALLFLLFDLEILLIYPYVVSAYINNVYGLVIMLIFFLALTLGFAFELGKNALKIDSRQLYTIFKKKVTEFNQLANHSLIYKINYLKYFSKKNIFNRSLRSSSIRMFSSTISLKVESRPSSNQESNTENIRPLDPKSLPDSSQPSSASSTSSASSASSISSTYDFPESDSGDSTPRASYTGGSGDSTPRARPIDIEHAKNVREKLNKIKEEEDERLATEEERLNEEDKLKGNKFKYEDDSRIKEEVDRLRELKVGEKLDDNRYVSKKDVEEFMSIVEEYSYLYSERENNKEFLESVKADIEADIEETKMDIDDSLQKLGIKDPSDNNSKKDDTQDSKDQPSNEETESESVSSEEAKPESVSDENSDNNSDMPLDKGKGKEVEALSSPTNSDNKSDMHLDKGKGIDLDAHPNYKRGYINPQELDSENKSLDKSREIDKTIDTFKPSKSKSDVTDKLYKSGSDSSLSDELPKSNNRVLFDIDELNYFLPIFDKITPYLHYLDNIPLFCLRLILQIASHPHIGLILYCTL